MQLIRDGKAFTLPSMRIARRKNDGILFNRLMM